MTPTDNTSWDYADLNDEFQTAMDTYQRDLVTYYIGIASLILCCLGMVGNILSLIVLTRKIMNSTTYTYLTGLAVCDLLVLVFTMIIVVQDTQKPEILKISWEHVSVEYAYMFPWVHPLAITFQVTSVWLTLSFTADRYIMICWPFQAQMMCTKMRARLTILGLYIGGILFNLPKFFEYQTQELAFGNQTRAIYGLTSFGKSDIFRKLFHSWLYLIFVCGVPFLSLAVLNGFLINAVRLSRKKGKEINVKDNKRNDTTIMLISVVVVFFICQAPALISRMIWAFDPSLAFTSLSIHTLSEVSNLLVILNSSINFVPYYFFGRKFRQQCWKIFCCCCFKRVTLRRLSLTYSPGDNIRRESEALYTKNFIKSLSKNGFNRSHRNSSSATTMIWLNGHDAKTFDESEPLAPALAHDVDHNRNKDSDTSV